MWMLSEHGACWVGQNRNNADEVLIRARRREHLEALFPAMKECRASFNLYRRARGLEPWDVCDVEILETPAYDFPYRITLPRGVWELVAGHLAATIDYGTFKGRLRDRHGANSPYYSFIVACWAKSFDMEDWDRGHVAAGYRESFASGEPLDLDSSNPQEAEKRALELQCPNCGHKGLDFDKGFSSSGREPGEPDRFYCDLCGDTFAPEEFDGPAASDLDLLEKLLNEGCLDEDGLELFLDKRGFAECLWCKEGGEPFAERVFSKLTMKFVDDRCLGPGWLCAECQKTAEAEAEEEAAK